MGFWSEVYGKIDEAAGGLLPGGKTPQEVAAEKARETARKIADAKRIADAAAKKVRDAAAAAAKKIADAAKAAKRAADKIRDAKRAADRAAKDEAKRIAKAAAKKAADAAAAAAKKAKDIADAAARSRAVAKAKAIADAAAKKTADAAKAAAKRAADAAKKIADAAAKRLRDDAIRRAEDIAKAAATAKRLADIAKAKALAEAKRIADEIKRQAKISADRAKLLADQAKAKAAAAVKAAALVKEQIEAAAKKAADLAKKKAVEEAQRIAKQVFEAKAKAEAAAKVALKIKQAADAEAKRLAAIAKEKATSAAKKLADIAEAKAQAEAKKVLALAKLATEKAAEAAKLAAAAKAKAAAEAKALAAIAKKKAEEALKAAASSKAVAEAKKLADIASKLASEAAKATAAAKSVAAAEAKKLADLAKAKTKQAADKAVKVTAAAITTGTLAVAGVAEKAYEKTDVLVGGVLPGGVETKEQIYRAKRVDEELGLLQTEKAKLIKEASAPGIQYELAGGELVTGEQYKKIIEEDPYFSAEGMKQTATEAAKQKTVTTIVEGKEVQLKEYEDTGLLGTAKTFVSNIGVRRDVGWSERVTKPVFKAGSVVTGTTVEDFSKRLGQVTGLVTEKAVDVATFGVGGKLSEKVGEVTGDVFKGATEAGLTTIRDKPMTGVVDPVATWMGVGAGLGGAAKAVKKVADVTKLSSVPSVVKGASITGKTVGLAMGAGYVGTLGMEVAAAAPGKRAEKAGELIATDILPMAAGGYLGTKVDVGRAFGELMPSSKKVITDPFGKQTIEGVVWGGPKGTKVSTKAKIEALGIEPRPAKIELIPGRMDKLKIDPAKAVKKYGKDIPLVDKPKLPEFTNKLEKIAVDIAKKQGDVYVGSGAAKVLIKRTRTGLDVDLVSKNPLKSAQLIAKQAGEGAKISPHKVNGIDVIAVTDKFGNKIDVVSISGYKSVRSLFGYGDLKTIEVEGLKLLRPQDLLKKKVEVIKDIGFTGEKATKTLGDITAYTEGKVVTTGPAYRGAYGYTAAEQAAIVAKKGPVTTSGIDLFGVTSKGKKDLLGRKVEIKGEKPLWGTPATEGVPQARVSRLGLESRAPTPKELLSGKYEIGAGGKPQIVVFPEAKTGWKGTGRKSGELETTYLFEQPRATGMIEYVKKAGTTTIKGQRVDILSAKIVSPSKELKELLKLAETGKKLTTTQTKKMKALTAKETKGFYDIYSGVSTGAKRVVVQPGALFSPGIAAVKGIVSPVVSVAPTKRIVSPAVKPVVKSTMPPISPERVTRTQISTQLVVQPIVSPVAPKRVTKAPSSIPLKITPVVSTTPISREVISPVVSKPFSPIVSTPIVSEPIISQPVVSQPISPIVSGGISRPMSFISAAPSVPRTTVVSDPSRPRPKPVRRVGISPGKPDDGAKKAVYKKQGYNVYGKEKKSKRFRKLNKVPLTKAKAKDVGAYMIDHSLAATWKIKKTSKMAEKKVLETPSGYYARTSRKYRANKIRKGKKVPMKDKWIEKRGKRLDTRDEVRKITLAKKIKEVRAKPAAKKKAVKKTPFEKMFSKKKSKGGFF